MRSLLHRLMVELSHHRKLQVVLSIGTVASVVLWYLWPANAEFVVACNVCTNAIWIWGE